jgi:hypothetical protein
MSERFGPNHDHLAYSLDIPQYTIRVYFLKMLVCYLNFYERSGYGRPPSFPGERFELVVQRSRYG